MSRVLPGIQLTGFWGNSFNGWDPDMDANLLKLSSLVQAMVLSRVAAEPGGPANGDKYLLTATANADKIIVRDNGAWTYYTPKKGWVIYSVADDKFYYYSAANTWVNIVTALPDFLKVSNNLSDLGNPGTARTNLGLGSAATQSSGFFLLTSGNLADVPNPTTARAALGIGTTGTQTKDTDGTLAANSDSNDATQKAVRTYVDNLINRTMTYVAGQKGTATDLGTKSSGTLTPTIDATNLNLQRVVNGGAFALAAPSTAGDYTIILEITNNGSAGAISYSGWTKNPDGDALTTVNTNIFLMTIVKLNGHTSATIKALQ